MSRDLVVTLLSDLVAIDSVNPSLASSGRGEADVAAFLVEIMRDAGLRVTTQDALPGRPNGIGTIEGRRAGRTLLLCGHTDTAAVTGLDRPLTPDIRVDAGPVGGPQDMKGGLAAMVDAARV